MRTRLTAVLQGIVILAVVATVAQVVLENAAMVAGREWQERYILLMGGFGLDVFFTVEFLTRFYLATLNRRLGQYMFKERGWVAFVSSIPVVVLFSAPAVIAVTIGGLPLSGLAGVFGTAAALRIASLLRILRVLPVFVGGRDSAVVTTRRHGGLAGSLAANTVVIIAVVATLWSSFIDPAGVERTAARRYAATVEYVADRGLAEAGDEAELQRLAGLEPAILMVRSQQRTQYSRYDNAYYRARFGPADFGYFEAGDAGVFFDLRLMNATVAQTTLIFVAIVLGSVALVGSVYQRRFARTVIHPLVVIRRGLEDWEYRRAVEIPERHADEETFRVARAYNETVLPLKSRERFNR